jgi:ABC-type sugar transport system permease subunit
MIIVVVTFHAKDFDFGRAAAITAVYMALMAVYFAVLFVVFKRKVGSS